ncbi:MAG: glycosyltransferase [Myxococcota bacterium]
MIRYSADVVEHLRTRGHQVDVLAPAPGTQTSLSPSSQGTVINVPAWFQIDSAVIAPMYPTAFCALAKGYDLLHFNFPSPIAELSLLAFSSRLKQVRKVVTYHSDIVPAKRFSGLYNKFITRSFLDSMDDIIVTSSQLLNSSPHLKALKSRTQVIPLGVPSKKFALHSVKKNMKRPLQVLFVGRLSRYKGIDYLIAAMPKLNAELRVVGAGPLEASLRSQISSLSLQERITLLGNMSESKLISEYHAADVLVLPSTDSAEAFGYVLIEAMMARCAVVSTELGTGTSFVNQHGETGFVLPPKDSAAIHRALTKLDRDRGLLKDYQGNAYNRAIKHFGIECMLEMTANLFEGDSNKSSDLGICSTKAVSSAAHALDQVVTT